jgi:hypothetical protein
VVVRTDRESDKSCGFKKLTVTGSFALIASVVVSLTEYSVSDVSVTSKEKELRLGIDTPMSPASRGLVKAWVKVMVRELLELTSKDAVTSTGINSHPVSLCT